MRSPIWSLVEIYFQGECLDDVHSLHITFSCHQQNTFGDLLMKMMPVAVETAMEEDVQFRLKNPQIAVLYLDLRCCWVKVSLNLIKVSYPRIREREPYIFLSLLDTMKSCKTLFLNRFLPYETYKFMH